MISAEILADSRSPWGMRLTTYKLVFPRYLLAEVNTHRMLSKNSASSRAIPFKRMVRTVKANPFIPTRFMRDHKGMQGSAYLVGRAAKLARFGWLTGMHLAVLVATLLHKLDVTKQLANRLLEPFMYHTALVSGTEWENFFALRAHEAAEINFQDLAYKMLKAYNASTPKDLYPGEWHIPYDDFTGIDFAGLSEQRFSERELMDDYHYFTYIVPLLEAQIGTARNARLSYETLGDDPKRSSPEADLGLHDKLLVDQPMHASPGEHCAQVMSQRELNLHGVIEPYDERKVVAAEVATGLQVLVPRDSGEGYEALLNMGWCGNFRGFKQYRKMLPYENARDKRVYQHDPQTHPYHETADQAESSLQQW